MRINRQEILNRINKLFRLESGMFIQEVEDKAKAVIVCNERHITIVKTGSRTITGAGQLMACDADKNFYLKCIYLTVSKDVLNDSVRTYVRADLEDTNENDVTILVMSHDALRVDSQTVQICFNGDGLKLKKGATIDIVNAFTAGAQRSEGIAVGYYRND